MNFLNLRSIRKNFALIVFLAVFPAVVILFYSGMEQRRTTIEHAKSNVLLLTHSMAQAQKEITLSARETLSTLAIMTEVQSLDIQAVNVIFKHLIKRNPNYENIVLVDLKGNVLASGIPSKGINLADRKQIRDALKTKDFATGKYILTRIGNMTPAFPFAYPVIDTTGTIKAVLAVAVNLTLFSELYQNASLPPDSFVAITDCQGVRLYYYPAKESTNPVGKPIKNSNWKIAQATQEPGIITNTGSDGINRIFAFEPIRLKDNADPYMYVWTGVLEAFILAPANITMKRNLLLILLTTIGTLFISWSLGQKTLIEPIHNLIGMTEELAKGNFKEPIKQTERAAEFEKLTASFYDMADALSKNQKKLQSSEDRFKKLSRVTFEGIAIHNEWVVKDVNDSLTELFGYKSEEIVGNNAVELFFPKELHSLIYKNISKNIALPYEVMAKKKDGTLFPVEIESKDIIRGDEHFQVSAVRDITERKRAEREHKNLLGQLNQAQKMESIGRLAGGVAHDFNNMLGVILGHTELALLRAGEKHDLYTDLKEIQKAAIRSADITKQLLAFARKQTISPRKLDLNDTVDNMISMLRPLIGENIDLVWKPTAHIWPVKMDPIQIDQMLANLCVNARDAIKGVGKLTIETGKKTFDEAYCKDHPGFIPGDFSMLAVSDDGCGMDKHTLSNLFEPFYTTKNIGKGTGLGLSTVYGIVKQNNGFINVYSEPGLGSTFKIYLPRLFGDKDDNVVPQNKTIAGGTETILLVEDEPSILSMTRIMLERNGYRVLPSVTPEKAIKKAKDYSEVIDLLMTDVVMPGMNGRDLAGQIVPLYPDIRLLFMSGYSPSIIAHQGVLDEGVAFIQKPFSMADLTEKVREVLDMTSDKIQG